MAEEPHHHARIETCPASLYEQAFDSDEVYELKEYQGGEKVGVVGGFESEEDARDYHEENFDFPLVD